MLAVVLLCAGVVPVSAFWGQGHMLVSQIAELHLAASPQGKATLATVNDILADGLDAFPSSSSFVPAADWMDIIKFHNHIFAFTTWHYSNFPYNTDPNITAPPNSPPDATWALDGVLAGLKDSQLGAWGTQLYTRIVLHLVGDAHQPLHTVEMYSKAFPTGDYGGNKCKVVPPAASKCGSSVDNLHSVWDSVGCRYQDDPFFPDAKAPKHAWFDALKTEAERLMKAYPASHYNASVLNEYNITKWFLRGKDLAIKYAYQNDPSKICGSNLTEAYMKQAGDVATEQVVLAGYHLAGVLQQYTPKEYTPITPKAPSSPAGDAFPENQVILIAASAYVVGTIITGALVWCWLRRKHTSGRNAGYERILDEGGISWK